MIKHLAKTDKKTDKEVSRAEQLLYEVLGWNRLLEFYKQENSYLKTRLSLVVDHHAGSVDFLTVAEQFQTKFLQKDEFMEGLLQDVRNQEAHLTEPAMNRKLLDEKYVRKQQKIRNEIASFEREFSQLTHEFHKYLSEIL